jgi:hypothetical protein
MQRQHDATVAAKVPAAVRLQLKKKSSTRR